MKGVSDLRCRPHGVSDELLQSGLLSYTKSGLGYTTHAMMTWASNSAGSDAPHKLTRQCRRVRMRRYKQYRWKNYIFRQIRNHFSPLEPPPLDGSHLSCRRDSFCVLHCHRWVKGSPIGVLFPVLIALLAPLRLLLVRTPWFSESDMAMLDSEG